MQRMTMMLNSKMLRMRHLWLLLMVKLCATLASLMVQNIITTLLDFHVMAKVKAEMDQFREGLNTWIS